MNYDYHNGVNVPIKAWTKGVGIETQAMQQLHNLSSLPFIHRHIAVMPDVHWGMGATIGCVLATNGAIVPAAVGVDLGCGMMAVQTTLRANDLPDTLKAIRSAIEKAVPHGRTANGGRGDRGAWGDHIPTAHQRRWLALKDRYEAIIQKHPQAKSQNSAQHMGTLGTGNHFIELCLDDTNQLWVMLHSGSRGPGNRIGCYFIELAKQELDKYYMGNQLADKNLAYFVEHSNHFDDYLQAVKWAQDYASANRHAMMDTTLDVLKKHLKNFEITEMAINCHHNYVDREYHFGKNVWITRKGAVRARENELGIIPGSMGAESFIVRGKGNKDSFCSCSHGAGRTLSRSQAKKQISLKQHAAAMKGIEARLDADVLDESPAAYKNISAVMAAQRDLVEVVHRLQQIVNIKG